MVFLLNSLSLVGMLMLIVYTGYGMTSLPTGLIKGGPSVHSDRRQVEAEIAELESQVADIRARSEGAEMPQFDAMHVERLEQQLRLLGRTRRNLEQSSRSFINRIILCCRPFQVTF